MSETCTVTFVSPDSGREHKHTFTTAGDQFVHCDKEQFKFQGFCKWVGGGPMEYTTGAYGRPRPVAPTLSPQERAYLYQQYRAQRPPPPFGRPTIVGELLREAPHPAFHALGSIADGAAEVGRLLAEAARDMREWYFGKAAERAEAWNNAPTGEIKHLPPSGDDP
jgi:hypothetical protein